MKKQELKYVKKQHVICASQWFKNGDHPDDETQMITSSSDGGSPFRSEGKIVRYYRRPDGDGQNKCEDCGEIMHVHGWIDDVAIRKDGCVVCPGDWIIYDNGSFCSMSDGGFLATYIQVNTPKESPEDETVQKLTEIIGEDDSDEIEEPPSKIKMHKSGKYEHLGEDRCKPKAKFHDNPEVKFHGIVDGMIHMGCGDGTPAVCRYLHDLLDVGFEFLSGAQQNGGMGTEYDYDCEKECDKQIESVVREIVLSLTGKNIKFEE